MNKIGGIGHTTQYFVSLSLQSGSNTQIGNLKEKKKCRKGARGRGEKMKMKMKRKRKRKREKEREKGDRRKGRERGR